MSDFPVLLREGGFHKSSGGALLVSTGSGVPVVVDECLQPFEGKRVRIAAHHLPAWPEPGRWGGGSCGWEHSAAKVCPAGHHLRPNWLYNVSAEGVLVRDARGEWALEQVDGTLLALDMDVNLPGHFGRIVCALLATVEEMRDALGDAASLVDAVGGRATELNDLLGRLQTLTRGQ